MLVLAAWIAVTALACLAGMALFVLGWPGDGNRRRVRFGSAALAVVATAGSVIAGVLIFRGTFLADDQLPWLRWGVIACAAATFILIIRWLIGDRARGRRRCPKCWYDMSGTPVGGGLTCPECGKAVRHEQGLFRARRRAWLLPAAFVPAVLGVFMWSAGFLRDPEWASRLSNSALVLAAPFAGPDTKIAKEIKDTMGFYFPARHPREWSGWQRWVLAHVGRRAQRDPADIDRAFYGAGILLSIKRDDATTANTLITFTQSKDPDVVQGAALCMGSLNSDLAAAKRALGVLLTNRRREHVLSGLMGLGGILMRVPGGEPPAGLIQAAASRDTDIAELAIKLLALCDPHPDCRPALTSALDRPDTRPIAIVTLALLWPQDTEAQRLVLDALRTPAGESRMRDDVAYWLDFFANNATEHPDAARPATLALYTPEICDELERWLARFDADDRRYARTPEQSFAYGLRQTIAEARRLHATPPASTPTPAPR